MLKPNREMHIISQMLTIAAGRGHSPQIATQALAKSVLCIIKKCTGTGSSCQLIVAMDNIISAEKKKMK